MQQRLTRGDRGRGCRILVFAAAAAALLVVSGMARGDEEKKAATTPHVKKENGHAHEAAPKHGHSAGQEVDHDKEGKGHGHGPAEPAAAGHDERERGHGHAKAEKGHGDGGHGGAPSGLTPLQAKGFRLVSELHCNACHYIGKELEHGAGHHGGHGGVAPDLAFLGDKFRPEWLYEFLRKPHIVRPWLGIRMPDFRLSEAEAVALVRHLSQDMRNRDLPPLPEMTPVKGPEAVSAGRKLMSGDFFDCWSCHQRGEKKPEGPMENWAPDLELSARRLRPEWVLRWLRDPQKLMPGTKMPAFFENGDSGPDEILGGDEGRQIRAVGQFLLSLGKKNSGPSAYERAARRHPEATHARGFELMTELNCAGCHDVGGMHEREEAGPPLAHEGSRVKKEWLVGSLKKPYRIRPIGYTAGNASRMPDFRLTGGEAEAVAAYLMTRRDPRLHAHEKPHGVSKEKARRGKRLFASLRCGACHLTNGGRGRKSPSLRFSGPNLRKAGARLQEEHLRFWLAGDVTRSGSKLEMDAHPLVPRLGLTKKQIEELAAFVAGQK